MVSNEIPQPICSGLWAILEARGRLTLDQIQEATGNPHVANIPYLNALLERAYVRISGVTTAVSGETICMFELVRRNGPKAPYVVDPGVLVDPNLPQPEQRLSRKSGPQSEGRNLPARLRFAAERLARPFTKPRLEAAAGITEQERPAFQRAFSNLPTEIALLPDGRLLYRPSPDSDRERLRNFLRNSVGRWIGIAEIREFMGGKRGYAQSLRGARHLLLAEGYSVEAEDKRLPSCRYRVTPPPEAGQETNGA